VSTTAIPDRFTTLPDEHALQATVVALEEHGFSVEVVGDLDAARHAIIEYGDYECPYSRQAFRATEMAAGPVGTCTNCCFTGRRPSRTGAAGPVPGT
jgi:hypothetical protein